MPDSLPPSAPDRAPDCASAGAPNGAVIPTAAPSTRLRWASDLVDHDWPLVLALPMAAIVLVFVAPSLGWWALGIAAILFAVGLAAYRTRTMMDANRDGLIRTLGRLPELEGATEPGHSYRTARLAASLARELLMSEDEVRLVAEAARCRSVGRVGMGVDPALRPGFDRRSVDRWNAAIVGSVSSLGDVARIVGPLPVDAPPDLLIQRATIEVAEAFDDATVAMGLSVEDALSVISGSADAAAVSAVRALARQLGVSIAVA